MLTLMFTALCLFTTSLTANEGSDVSSETKDTFIEKNVTVNDKCGRTSLVVNTRCASKQNYSTPLPSIDLPCDNMVCLEVMFQRLELDCPEIELEFLCAYVFPPCVNNAVIRPSRRHCEGEATKCTNYKPRCKDLPDLPDLPESTEAKQNLSAPQTECVTPSSQFCEDVRDDPKQEMTTTIKPPTYSPLDLNLMQRLKSCNHPLAKFTLCGYTYPQCVEGQPGPARPCLDYCHEIAMNCPDLLSDVNCTLIEQDFGRSFCLDYYFRPTLEKRRILRPIYAPDRNVDTEVVKPCNTSTQWQCQNGKCIPIEKKCDGVYDCPDDSDEDKSCGCMAHEHACGVDCYPEEWRCDEEDDCPKREDEKYCNNAKSVNWTCASGYDIEKTKRCDGRHDCEDHTDERKCLSVEDKYLMAEDKRGVMSLPVCADNFNDETGQRACSMIGQTALKSWTTNKHYLAEKSLHLHTNGTLTTPLGRGDVVKKCPQDGPHVVLECMPKIPTPGPNHHEVPLGHIEPAVHGTWPWMAYIKQSDRLCGAAIINDMLIITSQHCLQKITLEAMEVVVGYNFIYGVDLKLHRNFSDLVFGVRASFTSSFENDHDSISLITLNRRITFNNFTKPLPLPDESDVFSKASACFLAGWGQMSCPSRKRRLQQRRLVLWDTKQCNSSTRLNGKLRKGEGCAGFHYGVVQIGRGDSGSPIFCSDEYERFKLVGIMSPVEADCMETRLITFTLVNGSLPWILAKTACSFRCANGLCFYPHDYVTCNNIDNCGDESDENQYCGDVSIDCTFENEFLCGYRISGKIETPLHHYLKSPLSKVHGGVYYGLWVAMYANSLMKSPMVTLDESHCLRFFYHLKNSSGLGAVIYQFDGEDMATKLDLRQDSDGELWQLGMFNVDKGPFQVIIRVYDGIFSIDEIRLLKGSCTISDECKNTGVVTNERCASGESYMTPLPSPHFLCNETKCLDQMFERIESDCDKINNEFLCAYVYPQCKTEKVALLPSRQFCQVEAAKCVTIKPNCNWLPDEESNTNVDECLPAPKNCKEFECKSEGVCIALSSQCDGSVDCEDASDERWCSDIRDSPESPEIECMEQNIAYCADLGFNSTTYSSELEHANKRLHQYYDLFSRAIVLATCPHPMARFYVCATRFPLCREDELEKIQPCADYCQEIAHVCPHVVNESECDAMLNNVGHEDCIDSSLRPTAGKKNHPIRVVLTNEADIRTECQPNQIQCPNSSACYMDQWICDGEKDCPGEEDEADCTCPGLDEWRCVNGDCVQLSQRCDGAPQCKDRSDERRCIFTSANDSTVQLVTNGSTLMTLCAKGFTHEHGKRACLKLGALGLKDWQSVWNIVKEPTFVLNVQGTTTSVLGKGDNLTSCPNGKAVSLECIPRGCGRSPAVIPPSNVEPADRGTWPWMAYIGTDQNKYLCGAAIISQSHVLTSAHCVRNLTDWTSIFIGTGYNFLLNKNYTENGTSYSPMYKLASVRHHIDYLGVNNPTSEVAVILLRPSIIIKKDTEPICLPDRDDVISRANECFLAGWGRSSCKPKITRLQQRKVTIWDVHKCNSSSLLNGTLRQGERCAEFYNGFVEIGRMDTGSPIFCNDEYGIFKVVGVMSAVTSDCLLTSIIRFTAVDDYRDWITTATACESFRCTNGRCLADKNLVCNNVDDCGDNSDEMRSCETDISCSFDEEYLCGYSFDQEKVKLLTSGMDDRERKYPLCDHTVGRVSGRWISLEKMGWIKSPMVNLTGSHCLRFFYYTRQRVDLGALLYHFDGENYHVKFDIRNKTGVARWLMGRFNVAPGQFQLVIRSYQDGLSIDDILLEKGSCSADATLHRCLRGEFLCSVKGTLTCLSEKVRCNIVKDCDEGVDETICRSREFTCDFENANNCGLILSDEPLSYWTLLSPKIPVLRQWKKVFKYMTGSVLRLRTSGTLVLKQVLLTNDLSYCLSFVCESKSPAELFVYFVYNDYKTVFRTVNLNQTSAMRVEVDLPARQKQVVLHYELQGATGRDAVETEIFLDQLALRVGPCFAACPEDTIRCGGDEKKCVHKSKVCDGFDDCIAKTDEKNCACKPSDFVCSTSKDQCVSREKVCNARQDCPDGGDEHVCEDKKKASCDFQDPFICGYTVDGSVRDHRKVRTHQIYNEIVNDFVDSPPVGMGSSKDYHMNLINASLTSVMFLSTGQRLRFRSYVFCDFKKREFCGRLVLSYKSNNQTNSLWSAYAGGSMSWTTQCVALPLGHIRIEFASQNTESNNSIMTRLGVDDILFTSGKC